MEVEPSHSAPWEDYFLELVKYEELTVIEPENFFEAYFHVLKSLKEIKGIPFEKPLIHLEVN